MDLAPKLLEWQSFYNYKRPHASLNGKTLHEKYLELGHLIPNQPDVTAKYRGKGGGNHSEKLAVVLPKTQLKLSHMC
jgi:hypothetical protein